MARMTDDEKAQQQADAEAQAAADALRDQANLTMSERMAHAQADAIEGELSRLDETQPGGRYIVGADAFGRGGTVVDANGEPVKDK